MQLKSSVILEVMGAVCVVAGAAWLHPGAGVLALGVVLILVGQLVDDEPIK